MPVAFNTPEVRFDCPEERKFAAIAEVKANLAEEGAQVEDIDGVRVTTADGWWLARASNTQAVLVVAGGGKLARGPGAAEGCGAAAIGPGGTCGTRGILSDRGPAAPEFRCGHLLPQLITTACAPQRCRSTRAPFRGGSKQRLRVLQYHVADLTVFFACRPLPPRPKVFTVTGLQKSIIAALKPLSLVPEPDPVSLPTSDAARRFVAAT